MIAITVNGNAIENFESIQVSQSMSNISSSFALKATAASSSGQVDVYPIRKGDPVTLVVDGTTKLVGFVFKVFGNMSSTNHDLQVSGYDKTKDIVDSTVGPSVDFKQAISMVNLFSKSLSRVQINPFLAAQVLLDPSVNTGPQGFLTQDGRISRFDDASRPFDFTDSDTFSANVGEHLGDFFIRVARKRQLLVTNDGFGNILITRSRQLKEPGVVLVHQRNNPLNNILESYFDVDDEQRFFRIDTRSAVPLSKTDDTEDTTSEQTNAVGVAIDNAIRQSRIKTMISETASDSGDLLGRAAWERDKAQVEGFGYRCRVQGHTMTSGRVWEPNLIIPVKDYFWGIDEELLLETVTWTTTLQGNFTELEFIKRNSYTINLKEPSEEADQGSNPARVYISEGSN